MPRSMVASATRWMARKYAPLRNVVACSCAMFQVSANAGVISNVGGVFDSTFARQLRMGLRLEW